MKKDDIIKMIKKNENGRFLKPLAAEVVYNLWNKQRALRLNDICQEIRSQDKKDKDDKD